MSRYIDKEKLKAELRKKIELSHKAKRAVIEEDFEDIINDMPTADVVEVVRCKDCIYHIAEYCTRDIKGRTNMFYMTADDFCSYGERKDGAEE